MKVMMISDHASPLAGPGGVDSGGQNVYVDGLSRALAGRGVDVDICTRRTDPRQPDIVSLARGVRLFHVSAGPPRFVRKEDLLPYMPEFTRRSAVLAAHGGYDLVHANFWMSGMTACALREAHGIPFVITFHALGRVRRLYQGGADAFPDERFVIEDRIMKEAAGIVAECPQDAEDLHRFYRADPERTVIVPCGVATGTFFPEDKLAARRRIGLPGVSRVLLQLGRIVPRKGIDTVVQALPFLNGGGPDEPVLVVVGGESERPDRDKCPELGRLMDLASRLGVRERVVFTGRRPQSELRWFYSAADVFITTPWYEPFGITPLEAMACGTPVIGARVGGVQYSVQEEVTGLLVPPKDPVALAERTRFLLQRPDLMSRFSKNGRQRVRRFFTWPRIAARMEALYHAAIARGARVRPVPLREPALAAATEGPETCR